MVPLNISTRYTLARISLYLEQILRSHCNYSLSILNFLLAYSVIQFSYRISFKSTVEFLLFEHTRGFKMWITECEFEKGFGTGS